MLSFELFACNPKIKQAGSSNKRRIREYVLVLLLFPYENKEAYESVLSIILNEKDLVLEEVAVEHVILNNYGKRAIRLDAIVTGVKEKEEWENMSMSIY